MNRQRGSRTLGNDASKLRLAPRSLLLNTAHLLLAITLLGHLQTFAAGPVLPPGALTRLGFHQFVHPDEIRSLTFSSDGSILLTESDKNAFLWEIKTGNKLRNYASGSTRYNAFSPDGQTVVLVSPDKNLLEVVEAATGKVRSTLTTPKTSRFGHSLVSHGNLLANSQGNEVLLWDTGQNKEVHRWRSSRDQLPAAERITPLKFSPEGKYLALACGDQTLELNQVWLQGIDPATAPVRLDAGNYPTRWLAFSPDGKLVVGTCEIRKERTSRTSFRIWDTATGKTLHNIGGSFNAGTFSPDGKSLAISSHWDVRLYDPASGKETARLAKSNERITAVAYSPDGKILATSQERRVRLWNTATWEELTANHGHAEQVTALAISPDNRTLVSGSRDGKLILWDWPEGKPRKQLPDIGGYRGIEHLNFSPDGKTLAVTGQKNAKTPSFGSLLSVESLELLCEFGKEKPFRSPIMFLPGGKELMTASGRHACVWDAATGHLVRTSLVSSNDVNTVHPLGSGAQVWWAGDYQGLGLRDLVTGQDLRRLLRGSHHGDSTLSLCPDGRLLAVDSHIWDLQTDQLIAEWHGNSRAQAFSPDSRLFATVHEREIVLWDTLLKKEIHRLAADIADSYRTDLIFSPDGKTLFSSDYTGILVWDLTGRQQDGQLLPLTATPEEMENWWRILGSNDHWEAHLVAWKFAAAGEAAARFISQRLSPAIEFDPEKFPLLPLAAKIRPPRAVMALEHNGTPAAKSLLESLSSGQPDAPLTQAAKAANARLRQRQLSAIKLTPR